MIQSQRSACHLRRLDRLGVTRRPTFFPMENLRRNYRHPFPPLQRLKVEIELLTSRQTHVGEIVDLSVDGMRVRFPDDSVRLAPGERVLARYAIPGAAPLQPAATVISSHLGNEGRAFGLQLSLSVHPGTAEARAKMIWRFLLGEQRGVKKWG